MFAHWQPIEQIDLELLSVARRQLHHAIQLPAMVGRSYCEADPEDQYGNLGWSRSLPGFVSHSLQPDTWQVVLNTRALELSMVSRSQGVLGTHALIGSDLKKAFGWLRTTISENSRDGDLLSDQLPYEIPGYQASCSFTKKGQEGFGWLTSLFGNTHLLLTYLAQQYPRVTPHRCWPHHFDMASLKQLGPQGGSREESSIGWGISPGDQSREEPYFYVNCWPRPQLDSQNLPALPDGGQWNLQGWTGTYLALNRYVAQKNQQEIIVNYFTGSIGTLIQLMTGH